MLGKFFECLIYVLNDTLISQIWMIVILFFEVTDAWIDEHQPELLIECKVFGAYLIADNLLREF